MTKENKADIFIRLLNEALEADKLIRRIRLSVRSKTRAERFKQLFRSDLKHAMHSIEPLDCDQMMKASERGTKAV